MEEMINASAKQLTALSATYPQHLLRDIELARNVLGGASEKNSEGAPAIIDALFTFAHDTKGQGATHGFPLLSELGSIMCGSIRALSNPAVGGAAFSAETLAMIHAQLDAMALVVARDLKGPGGLKERALIDELRTFSDQLRSRSLRKNDKIV